jgi:hypothetical protein
MKPPANVYAQVSRDRAAAGRYHVRAAVSTPGAQRVSPARQSLDDYSARLSLREARRRAGAAAAARHIAEERRKVGPRVAAALAAKAVPKPVLDKMREDSARAAGDDAPAPKRLSVADRERLARDYAARYGCTIEVARLAVARGAR